MKLSDFKKALSTTNAIQFKLPNDSFVPAHFHITEVGKITKNFIDCGGTVRAEETICMQLWESVDVWHQLSPEKLLNIIALSEKQLNIADGEIEIEYQNGTIGKYGVEFSNGIFSLTNKTTACLAEDKCGIPSFGKVKEKIQSCCKNKH